MLTDPHLQILWLEFLIRIPAFLHLWSYPSFNFKMGRWVLAMILKVFDVGVWHFAARLQSSSGRTRLFWCKYSHFFLFPRMNVEWLVQRSHLSLIRQNSVHPSERELVITGLQGTITEYCFRERLTPSCFVFARRDTSEETDWRPAADELQLGVKSVAGAVLPNSCNLYSFVSPSSVWIVKPGKWGRRVTLWSSKTGT